MSDLVVKVTSCWRGKNGKIHFKPLQLNKGKKDFFDGYLPGEFDIKVPNKECFPLPINILSELP